MGGLILAWAVGEGIIVWRSAFQQHKPPPPGDLLAATALFALLAVVAEYEPARAAAIALAWGLDLAVLMKVLPGAGKQQAAGKSKSKTPAPKVATA